MKMRAAVLEEFGEPLVVQEVELTEPEGGRGAGAAGRLRRLPHRPLHRLRRRPLRLLADGARPRGRRRRRGGRARASATSTVGDHVVTLFCPQCGECVHCRRRAHQPLPGDPRAAEQGLSARRHHAPAARRRGDPPLHGHLDLRRVHGDAGDRAREGEPRGAARRRLPVRLRALDRARRGDEHGEGPRGLDLRRLRRRHGRARRGRRLPPAGRRADHLRRPLRGPARARQGPGRDRDDDRRRGRGRADRRVDRTASAPTTPSRRPATSR